MPEFSWGEDVQKLMFEKRISEKDVRKVHKTCQSAIDIMEQCRNGELKVIPLASAPYLDLSDPSNPRWRRFAEGKFKFQLEYFPEKRRYTVFLAEPPPPKRGRRAAGAAAKVVRAVRRAAANVRKPNGKLTGDERALFALYNLYRSRCVTILYGVMLPRLRAILGAVRAVAAQLGAWARDCNWCMYRKGMDHTTVMYETNERRAVAAALLEFLAPQNVAPRLLARLERESVRIGGGIRLELSRFAPSKPDRPLWDPALFGELLEQREQVLA